jgi:hypothetical protein
MVPTKNECVNAALAELEKVGIRNVEIARGSKHPQLRFQINGIPRIFGVSGTPSDWRTPANTARDVRKLLRQHGITTAPDPRPAAPAAWSCWSNAWPRYAQRLEVLADGSRHGSKLRQQIVRRRGGAPCLDLGFQHRNHPVEIVEALLKRHTCVPTHVVQVSIVVLLDGNVFTHVYPPP